MSDVTRILNAIEQGDGQAADEVLRVGIRLAYDGAVFVAVREGRE